MMEAEGPAPQQAWEERWEERWEQCWPLVASLLPGRDLIRLCLSSRAIMSRISTTPGWWQQACADCLCWPPPQTAAAAMGTSSAADKQARQVLFAATALAHHLKHVRSPPPATVQLPPWLPGQPGVSRGFSRVDPNSLDPPLALTPTQLSWLAYGSLSGVCCACCVLCMLVGVDGRDSVCCACCWVWKEETVS